MSHEVEVVLLQSEASEGSNVAEKQKLVSNSTTLLLFISFFLSSVIRHNHFYS